MRGAVAIAATLVLAGCSLATTGLLDPTPVNAGGGDAGTPALDATTAPAEDAEAPQGEASAGDDAGSDEGAGDAPSDGTGAQDSALVDAASCPPPGTDPAVSVVTSIATPPIIDGDLTEWGCGPWTALDRTNAAVATVNGQTISAQFALRWDKDNLYVAVHTVVAMLQGSDGNDPYKNDAVEIYVSGDAARSGDYDPLSHQYVVDWHDLAVDYGPVSYSPNHKPVKSPPHFRSRTKVVSDGWQVEAAIGWQTVMKPGPGGATGFTPGGSLSFDLQLDDGDGNDLLTWLIAIDATHAPACGCQSCCCGQADDRPSCDTLCYGGITLQ